jgi:uncharacterized lipoprotein
MAPDFVSAEPIGYAWPAQIIRLIGTNNNNGTRIRKPTKNQGESMIIKHIGVTAIVVALGGCAFTPQAPIVIKPAIEANHSNVGAGQSLQVVVIDERTSKTLGTRGVRGVGSELTVAGDLAQTIDTSIAEGLKNQGFVPTEHTIKDGRVLNVEIRDLEYNMIMGFWAGTMRTQCSLKAVCVVGNVRPFEKMYHGEHEESVQVVQSADANTGYVNDAVSKAVNQLLDDPDLAHCLASPVLAQ